MPKCTLYLQDYGETLTSCEFPSIRRAMSAGEAWNAHKLSRTFTIECESEEDYNYLESLYKEDEEPEDNPNDEEEPQYYLDYYAERNWETEP